MYCVKLQAVTRALNNTKVPNVDFPSPQCQVDMPVPMLKFFFSKLFFMFLFFPKLTSSISLVRVYVHIIINIILGRG